MASTLVMRQRAAPAAAGLLAVGITFFPRTTLHAEAPDQPEAKKSIYDDQDHLPSPPSTELSSAPLDNRKNAPSPTPTDRLATQIGKTRLFIYAHVAAAENKVNRLMDAAFDLESNFVSTIASLAPPRQSGEKIIPGSLYVLVTAMAGSIVARNRNVVLRASLPLAVGVGAGWVVLPVTMRNISDLLWKYEERFPAIADGHLRTRDGMEKAWRMATIHTQQAGNILDEKLASGRGAVEGWIHKGK